MKRLLIAAMATAAVLNAGVAFADNASGTIKSIDQATRTFTLDNGKQYMAASSVDISKLKVGEKVTLDYSSVNGKNEVHAVKM